MTAIDSHAHLDLPAFDTDRDAVIQRALQKGVSHIITVGIGKQECVHALQIAEDHPQVFAALGIHPHNAADCDLQALDMLEQKSRSSKVVALGEIGLDFYRNLSGREEQIRAFRTQLDLARSLKLPVIIHDREAHTETLAILREEKAGEYGGVVHCFSGDVRMAFSCIESGFHISIPGTVTFKSARLVQEVVRKVPLDHLLVETDCPFLAPAPYRGKRNEPAYVIHVAEAIAAIKGITPEEAGRVTAQNTRSLFSFD